MLWDLGHSVAFGLILGPDLAAMVQVGLEPALAAQLAPGHGASLPDPNPGLATWLGACQSQMGCQLWHLSWSTNGWPLHHSGWLLGNHGRCGCGGLELWNTVA